MQPIGAVTVGLAGEALAELGTMATSAAQVRIFSDDGHCVSDPRLMRRALEYVKAFDGVIAQHAEEPRLTAGAQMHEGEVSARLGLTGWPAVAEEAIIARDALLAEHVGARLHICHVSTAGSVEIIRWAKARGIRITAEVTPHHLLLTDELAESYDPVYKVNPPLRTDADVAALRAALVDGVIDVVATDHAPHAVEDKECEWEYARPGMLGLRDGAVDRGADVPGRRRRSTGTASPSGCRGPRRASRADRARPRPGARRAGEPDARRPGLGLARRARASWPARAATRRTPGWRCRSASSRRSSAASRRCSTESW